MSDGANWQLQIAENAQRHRDLSHRLSQLLITETSRDGAVRVTVATSGLLTGLVLTESPGPISRAQLAGQIMECVRRAQSKIPDLLRQVITESVGATDANTHLLVAEARQRFPEPPPGGAAAPVRARAVHEPWGDENPAVWDV